MLIINMKSFHHLDTNKNMIEKIQSHIVSFSMLVRFTFFLQRINTLVKI